MRLFWDWIVFGKINKEIVKSKKHTICTHISKISDYFYKKSNKLNFWLFVDLISDSKMFDFFTPTFSYKI